MLHSTNLQEITEKVAQKSAVVEILMQEMHRVVVGQDHMIRSLLIALLADGHVLLEGLPGLAKTLAIKTLAAVCNVQFQRIQFTPDLLPSDILGTQIYSPRSEEFMVKKGPIFANFILADEINRSPAKVQSALLEVMQEKQVTLADQTYHLQEPFLVLATQNPLEQEGTYALPEAQQDRFMLKVVLDYPTVEQEKQMLYDQVIKQEKVQLNPILSSATILELRQLVRMIYVDEKIIQYVLDLVNASRYPQRYGLSELQLLLAYGASPRASIALIKAAQAHAFIKHRAYVIPDDIRAVAFDVLVHRIGLTYEAQAESKTAKNLVEHILATVEVP